MTLNDMIAERDKLNAAIAAEQQDAIESALEAAGI